MEEQLQEHGMLSGFISHFHQFSHLSASIAPHLLLSHSYPRWCCFNVDENPMKDNCCEATMTEAEKPKTFKMFDICNSSQMKKPRREKVRGKQSRCRPSSETMDQETWKEFPEDLMEAVIARLPISAFFRLRSVCQKWNSLVTSPSFSQHCAQLPRSHPWFYTVTHENGNSRAIYDPSMRKWRHPIPVFPPKIILLPVASSGGLICFLDIGHRYFYVCNPLTHSWKELPARSVKVWSQVAVGMIQTGRNSNSNSYKILWVGRDGEYEIYNSLKNSWARPGNLPSTVKLPLSLNFRSHSVSIGSTVYFLSSNPEGIISYDMVSQVWKQYLIPAPPNSTDHNLAKFRGQILLVGLITKNAASCVCIWELQKMMLLWKEVDRMPNEQCLEFYGKHVEMTCLGNSDLLMLSLRSRQMNRIVSYDMATQDWSKVPGCVLTRGRKRQWTACGTAFIPSLTATP